jgi:hypothetical protein
MGWAPVQVRRGHDRLRAFHMNWYLAAWFSGAIPMLPTEAG